MPKIFLYASAALLLASAGLSYLNKTKLTDKLAELSQSKAATVAAQGDATKSKAAQKTAENNATAATTRANDLQGQLTTAGGQLTDLNGKLDAVTKSVAEKDAKITELTTAMANTPKTPTGDIIPDAGQKIADLTRERDELKVVKDGLEGQVKGVQAERDGLARQIKARNDNSSMNGLHGQVLAVDHNWNFVVINLGNRNGVNSSASMIIERGGSLVGRIKVTSVEPSQSVADILPNSVPAGIDVRPGDTVIFRDTER